ncbi:hypothetical protein [Methylobacter sp. BlB1]|uniref:hypothetical protein n=1 Tax=Methylobacter sp. BlB1 TaxID=2785914 RepID=UPI00351B16B0
MTNTAFKQASYQDILDLPENIVGEIINGHLETHPRPTPKHALASSSLGDELVSPFQKGKGGPGGWWIMDEPECHLGPHVLVPDLAGSAGKSCRRCRKRHGLRQLLTGFVKYCRRQPHASTGLLKCRFTRNWGSATSG